MHLRSEKHNAPESSTSAPKRQSKKKRLTFVPASTLRPRRKRTFVEPDSDDENNLLSGRDPLRSSQAYLPIKPAKAPSNETEQTVHQRWTASQERWLDSSGCASIRGVLTQYIEQHGVPPLKNMICIGLGSPSGLSVCGHLEDRERVPYQLAAFLSMVEMLQSTPPVAVCAQDPSFNELDRQLLEELGIIVLEHPEAWDIIDQESLVWMPGPENRLFWGVAMLQPAVFAPVSLDIVSKEWHPGFDEFEQSHCCVEFSDVVEEDGGRDRQILPTPPYIYLPLPEEEEATASAKTGLGGPGEIGGSDKGKGVDGKGKGKDDKGKGVDGKGKGKDDKGKGVDGKGKGVDGKEKSVDGKGKGVDVKGKGVDVKGKSVDVKGKGKDDKGKGVGVKGKGVDVKGKGMDAGVWSVRGVPPSFP